MRRLSSFFSSEPIMLGLATVLVLLACGAHSQNVSAAANCSAATPVSDFPTVSFDIEVEGIPNRMA